MPVRLLIVASLAATLCYSTGCSAFRPSDKAVIGQANAVHSELASAIIQDPEVQKYMDQLGQRIIAGATDFAKDPGKLSDKDKKEDNSWIYQGDIRFHLVNSKTLNAFTTGGQHVYIYNELFQKAGSEDELAAVMAHEFAHIFRRHVANGMTRATEASAVQGIGALAASAVGGGAGQVASLGANVATAATQFMNMGFSRGDEDEADKYGLSFYIRAGWDPNHFADFFKRMIELGYDTTPQYASDHPTLASRVKKTEARVAGIDPQKTAQRRKPDTATPEEFRRIQQRAVAASKNTPDDQSLAKAQLMLQAFPSCVTPVDQPDQIAAKKRILSAASAQQ